MLTGMLGIRLVLLIGKAVPVPAPYEVMKALTQVKVIQDTDGNDGFQMTFTIGKDTSADYRLLSGGNLDPERRVIIGIMLGVTPEPLIDGVIYHHQVEPSNEPGMSTLTVSGRDISVMLSLEDKNKQFRQQSDSVIALNIISTYSRYVQIPQVTQTSDTPMETDRIPGQHENDLDFLRRIAKRNGFVFYIESVTIGVNKAYWGPENRIGAPQPALTLNMGAATNVSALSFSHDALAPVGTAGSFIEPATKMSMAIPPLPSFKMPPLAMKPSEPKRTHIMRNTAKLNPTKAALELLTAATNQPDPVKTTGKLDTARYGHILRARRLVGVRGAGLTYNGVYKVNRVTHDINLQGEGQNYVQEFELSREGTGALLPVLPV